jgi:dTDP-glucose 4,6-dehydratase
VVPTIISQVLAGNVVKLGSLRPTRDLNFVANTVDAFVACAVAAGVVGQTLHFGTGREISIGDLAAAIARIAGKEVRVEEEVNRLRPAASEVERLLANNAKAKRLIGWEPRVDLDAGLATTVEWMRANLGHYRVGKYER